MLIKSSMVELETWDQCHLVMDEQGFPHDIFSKTLGPPKYPKIKLEVKKRRPREHLAENIPFLTRLLNLLW